MSTCENNTITGGSYSNNTLSLTRQGGGSVDINFPESQSSVILRFTGSSSQYEGTAFTVSGAGTTIAGSYKTTFSTSSPEGYVIGANDKFALFYDYSYRSAGSLSETFNVGTSEDWQSTLRSDIIQCVENANYTLDKEYEISCSFNATIDFEKSSLFGGSTLANSAPVSFKINGSDIYDVQVGRITPGILGSVNSFFGNFTPLISFGPITFS